MSGAELAARLGLPDTWAYFSVRNGHTVGPEPDRSGAAPSPSAAGRALGPASDAGATATAPQGGAQAPTLPGSTPTGGAAAG